MPRWYVLTVDPSSEYAAAFKLTTGQIRAYCPVEPKSIKASYFRRRVVMRPMLTGYVLATWDGSAEQWARIHDVRGVRRMLKVGDRPAPVPDEAVSYLREREAEAMANFGKKKRTTYDCKLGDLVWIVDHPTFGGLPGRVVGFLDGKRRILLHVELFKRQTPCEVSASQVRAL